MNRLHDPSRIVYALECAENAIFRAKQLLEQDQLVKANVEIFEARSWLGNARHSIEDRLELTRSIHIQAELDKATKLRAQQLAKDREAKT